MTEEERELLIKVYFAASKQKHHDDLWDALMADDQKRVRELTRSTHRTEKP
jgi:hypothetical protein